LLTAELRKRLADRDIQLVLSDAAREFIARRGFDPVYGARPLRRFLQHGLETRIGRALIAGNVLEGATIRVDVREDALTTAIDNPQPEAVGALAWSSSHSLCPRRISVAGSPLLAYICVSAMLT